MRLHGDIFIPATRDEISSCFSKDGNGIFAPGRKFFIIHVIAIFFTPGWNTTFPRGFVRCVQIKYEIKRLSYCGHFISFHALFLMFAIVSISIVISSPAENIFHPKLKFTDNRFFFHPSWPGWNFIQGPNSPYNQLLTCLK